MFDRPRMLNRGSLFSGVVLPDSHHEATSGRRHAVSPPTNDSFEVNRSPEPTDRLGPDDDDANGLGQTLRDLIESLPRGAVESARRTVESTPDAIVGPVTLTFDDQSAVERRVESEDGAREGDSNSPVSGRYGLPAKGGLEDAPARSESGGTDHREEIAALSSITVLHPIAHGGLAGAAIANPTDLGEGPIVRPAFSVDRVGGVESPGAWAAEPTHPPVADTSSKGLAAAAIAGNLELHTDLGRWTTRPDRAATEPTMRGVASIIRMPPETVAVGPVGLATRHDVGIDRTSGESGSATTWSGLAGGDLLGSRPGAVSPADEGSAGVDLSSTNALLGQILDELRRHQQSALTTSGRLVYPER